MRAIASRQSASSSSPSDSFSRNAAAWFGPALTQEVHRLEPAGNVPARHHVGEGVVVHVLVVLVRPDHVPNVSPTIPLRHGPGHPEPGRIQQNLRAGAKEEIVVTGEAPVLP